MRQQQCACGQPQGIGHGETRRHAESVDTGGIQVRQVRHEEGRHERIEQLMSIVGCEFMRTETNVLKCQSVRT